MSNIKCFMIEPAMQAEMKLRRFTYVGHAEKECPDTRMGSHNAAAPFGHAPLKIGISVHGARYWELEVQEPPHDHADWPANCSCGYAFQPKDEWQLFYRALYKRVDGEPGLWSTEDAPAGAMWYDLQDERENRAFTGPDGKRLFVKTPGGDWCIDWRASNCTLPLDNEHRCWVRHGVPPEVTVDKNGHTCAAGAGSIVCGHYHGFLRNGYLENC